MFRRTGLLVSVIVTALLSPVASAALVAARHDVAVFCLGVDSDSSAKFTANVGRFCDASGTVSGEAQALTNGGRSPSASVVARLAEVPPGGSPTPNTNVVARASLTYRSKVTAGAAPPVEILEVPIKVKGSAELRVTMGAGGALQTVGTAARVQARTLEPSSKGLFGISINPTPDFAFELRQPFFLGAEKVERTTVPVGTDVEIFLSVSCTILRLGRDAPTVCSASGDPTFQFDQDRFDELLGD